MACHVWLRNEHIVMYFPHDSIADVRDAVMAWMKGRDPISYNVLPDALPEDRRSLASVEIINWGAVTRAWVLDGTEPAAQDSLFFMLSDFVLNRANGTWRARTIAVDKVTRDARMGLLGSVKNGANGPDS